MSLESSKVPHEDQSGKSPFCRSPAEQGSAVDTTLVPDPPGLPPRTPGVGRLSRALSTRRVARSSGTQQA